MIIAVAVAAQRVVAVFSPEMLGLFAQRTWQKVEGREWEIGKKKQKNKNHNTFQLSLAQRPPFLQKKVYFNSE